MRFKQKLYCNTLGCKMAFVVKAIFKVLRKRFEEEDLSLTLEQYFILNILDNEEGLILQELADIVEKDKSAVLRHIDALEEHHFVVRAQDPEDHRRKILIVTKPGMKVLRKARNLEEEVNENIAQNIDKDFIDEFDNVLAKLYKEACCKNS